MDATCIQALRLAERGLLPTVATSPSSTQFQFWTRALAIAIGRPEFTDLRALIVKHINFDELPTLVAQESPVLLVSAGDVIDGSFKIFSSALGEISPEALLASAAIPNLFPAVHVKGHSYWDGIFASNPPIAPLLSKAPMNGHELPEEIWVIQINRAHHSAVPETSSDIFDRRNQLAGNLSLQHELELLRIVNLILHEYPEAPGLFARFGLNMHQPIQVRFLRMSFQVAESLDYPSKLSRHPAHIGRLIADGAAQASAFLAELDEAGRAGEPSDSGMVEGVAVSGPLGPH